MSYPCAPVITITSIAMTPICILRVCVCVCVCVCVFCMELWFKHFTVGVFELIVGNEMISSEYL